MEEFGQEENEVHMGEERMNKLYDLCKPLDDDGHLIIEKLVEGLVGCWEQYRN